MISPVVDISSSVTSKAGWVCLSQTNTTCQSAAEAREVRRLELTWNLRTMLALLVTTNNCHQQQFSPATIFTTNNCHQQQLSPTTIATRKCNFTPMQFDHNFSVHYDTKYESIVTKYHGFTVPNSYTHEGVFTKYNCILFQFSKL